MDADHLCSIVLCCHDLSHQLRCVGLCFLSQKTQIGILRFAGTVFLDRSMGNQLDRIQLISIFKSRRAMDSARHRQDVHFLLVGRTDVDDRSLTFLSDRFSVRGKLNIAARQIGHLSLRLGCAPKEGMVLGSIGTSRHVATDHE